MTGALLDNPYRAGKRLRGDLAGIHSARRGTYRVLYRIRADADVIVLRANTAATPTDPDDDHEFRTAVLQGEPHDGPPFGCA